MIEWLTDQDPKTKIVAAEALVPWHPTLADVLSREGLREYQATKKVNRKLWESGPAPD